MLVCDYLFIRMGQVSVLKAVTCFVLDFGEGIALWLCARVDCARVSPPLLGPRSCEGCLIAGAGTHLVEGDMGVAEVNVQHGPNERQRHWARRVMAPLLPALCEVKKQSKDCKKNSQYRDVAPAQ